MRNSPQSLSLLFVATMALLGCFDLPEALTEIPDTEVSPDTPVAGPCAGLAEGANCNDQNNCTQDDQCQKGVCVGSPYTCDSVNTCTKAVCLGDGNCDYIPDNTLCDDGVPCTDDLCSIEEGCVFSPNHAACPGSTELCWAYQCLSDCTDPNCTDDGCQHATIANYDNCSAAVCPISGAPGQVSYCSIDVVLSSQAINMGVGPARMKFSLTFDTSKVAYETHWGPVPGTELPGGSLLTGHQVVVTPDSEGTITIEIFPVTPDKTITLAPQGVPEKGPTLMTLQFKVNSDLKESIRQSAPSLVTLQTGSSFEAFSADSDSTAMEHQVENNQLVLCKPISCLQSCEGKKTGEKAPDGCFDEPNAYPYGCPCGWTPTACQPEVYKDCPEEFSFLAGDLNCSGVVDILDIQGLALYIIGEEICGICPKDPIWFDLNCDGKVDTDDDDYLTLLDLGQSNLYGQDNDEDGIHNNCDPDDDNDFCPDQCEVDNMEAGGEMDALVSQPYSQLFPKCDDCQCFWCLFMDTDEDKKSDFCDPDDDGDGYSDKCELAESVNTDPKDIESKPTESQVANEPECQ